MGKTWGNTGTEYKHGKLVSKTYRNKDKTARWDNNR